jgi:hypothetical protein
MAIAAQRPAIGSRLLLLLLMMNERERDKIEIDEREM